MANVKQGQLTPAPQWAKHLRDWKQVFWGAERRAGKALIAEEVLGSQDVPVGQGIGHQISTLGVVGSSPTGNSKPKPKKCFGIERTFRPLWGERKPWTMVNWYYTERDRDQAFGHALRLQEPSYHAAFRKVER